MSNKPQYRLLEFGLSKKPWYRILIVNFYTELQSSFAWSRNRIPFFSFLFLKNRIADNPNFESTFVGVQKTNKNKIKKLKFAPKEDEIHPIKKEIIRIRNRKNFFFFFQIQFFIYLLFQNSPESNFIFQWG
ncbi:hypothetical protein ACJX0J_004832 [Zea mays]